SIIERTVAANLTLQQAEARVREARASRRIAAAPLWPQIGSSGSYTRARTSKNGLGAVTPGKWTDLFQAGFDGNWELDVFGGNRRALEAAEASLEAAEDDRNAVLVSLLGEVGLQYVTYRSLQRRVAPTQQNLEAQRQTLELTHPLFDAGLAPELHGPRAHAPGAAPAPTSPVREPGAAGAARRLGVPTGGVPTTLEPELAAVAAIPRPPEQVAVGLPSELLLRRPDVARAERELASQTAEVGVATSDLFPRFFLSGIADLQSVHASDFFLWES